ncbi:MAG: hypothetical protein DCC58_03255 [Chloroflexi bacterium]|nr:MAG: hypothetical protein DCC58_03255 [Chloroflexota bacterium]
MGTGVGVGVGGTGVGVFVGRGVLVGLGVLVGRGVLVGLGVRVGVGEGARVAVAVAVGVDEAVGSMAAPPATLVRVGTTRAACPSSSPSSLLATAAMIPARTQTPSNPAPASKAMRNGLRLGGDCAGGAVASGMGCAASCSRASRSNVS